MSSMKHVMVRVAMIASEWLPDTLLLTGAGLVSYGTYAIYAPAGIIVCGSFLIVAGRLAARSVS